MEENILKVKSGEAVTPKGVYTFISMKRDPSDRELNRLRQYVRGDMSARKEISHLIKEETEVHNLVPIVGRNVLARLLSGDTTYTGEINYGALGDGTTAFNNASTQLNNEIYRKVNASSSYEDNITYVDWFIASGDVADQTFEEFGAFIDGTASADSGQAFSLVITGGWTKSGSIFISLKITLS